MLTETLYRRKQEASAFKQMGEETVEGDYEAQTSSYRTNKSWHSTGGTVGHGQQHPGSDSLSCRAREGGGWSDHYAGRGEPTPHCMPTALR